MGSTLIVLVILAGPVIAGWWLFRTVNSPMVRASRQIGIANMALAEERYDDAMAMFQSAQALVPGIRDDNVRDHVQYATEHGLAVTCMQMGDPETAHGHLLAAAEQLEATPQTSVTAAYLYTELASVSMSLGNHAEADAALEKLRVLCEDAIDQDRSDLSEILNTAASGATDRSQPELARQLSDLVVEYLDQP